MERGPASRETTCASTAAVAQRLGISRRRLAELCQELEQDLHIRRGPAGRREFSDEDVRRLEIVVKALTAGATLADARAQLQRPPEGANQPQDAATPSPDAAGEMAETMAAPPVETGEVEVMAALTEVAAATEGEGTVKGNPASATGATEGPAWVAERPGAAPAPGQAAGPAPTAASNGEAVLAVAVENKPAEPTQAGPAESPSSPGEPTVAEAGVATSTAMLAEAGRSHVADDLRAVLERHDILITAVMHHLLQERRLRYQRRGLRLLAARWSGTADERDYLAEAQRQLLALRTRSALAPRPGEERAAQQAGGHSGEMAATSAEVPTYRRLPASVDHWGRLGGRSWQRRMVSTSS